MKSKQKLCPLHQGGLKHEQLNTKAAVCYPCQVTSHCLVWIFKKYIELLSSTLYLQVNSKKRIVKGQGWFIDSPVGENSLGGVVKKGNR